MKAVSLSLKILAIAAAAFAVYAWQDIRGKISTAESHMKGVPGKTLVEKAPKVPGLLKKIAEQESKIKNTKDLLTKSEGELQSANSELEAERQKNVEANAEISKGKAEISKLNASLAESKQKIAKKDSEIDGLRREIVSTKAMLAQNNEADELKEKVATLESQLNAKTQALADAEKRIKTLEASEVVEVVETDAAGNKVVKKVLKTPYEPKGDIATVMKVDAGNALVVINRGEKAGVKNDQKIQLKREGVLVSEIVVADAKEDFAVAYVNRNVGIPETIEVGDLLELAVAAAPAPEAAAPAEKKSEDEEGAAPAAPAENTENAHPGAAEA